MLQGKENTYSHAQEASLTYAQEASLTIHMSSFASVLISVSWVFQEGLVRNEISCMLPPGSVAAQHHAPFPHLEDSK